jgi:UDP-N-acetylglucosamine 2-epimerase (non-hydrolysing)
MLKPVCVFSGTRPEAIKLAPLVLELKSAGVPVQFILTGQHPGLGALLQTEFGLTPDAELAVFRAGQSLSELTSKIVASVGRKIAELDPAMVVVHGDTQSALGAALAAFTSSIPVAHVEAGLRTHALDSPFPEEGNRQMIARVAEIHFAPDERARKHLCNEGVPESKIYVVGNTIEDSIQIALGGIRRRRILLTLHRRECGAEALEAVLTGVRDLVRNRHDLEVVFPVHPNPNIREIAARVFDSEARVELLPPLPYSSFLKQMLRADLILSDSGGVQEEARILNRPLLVVRNQTERATDAPVTGADPVLCPGLIERVNVDPREVVAAIQRRLKPGSIQRSPSQEIVKAILKYSRGLTTLREVYEAEV